MNDWLDIGSSPPDESCAQMGSPDYYQRARAECGAYIQLLRRFHGPEPTGARLGIRRNEHDFGTYLSVACFYNPNIQAAIDYALLCESGTVARWDEQAKKELGSFLTDRKESADGHMD